jgi:hypothetical protein
LQQITKTYEEHNLKIPELEKKLRSQKAKHEKEIKNIESFYKEKLKAYSQKLNQYEEVKTVSNHSTINNHSRVRDDDPDRVNVNIFIS